MLDNFTFAPIQAVVMGSMIALTDVLLRPGFAGGGLEAILLYVAQTTILYVAFKFQSSDCRRSKATDNFDFGKMVMKVGLGTMILFLTDMVLRPEHVTNIWMQFLKFIIQGSIMWHVFNHNFSA